MATAKSKALTAKQIVAVEALLTHPTIAAAATAASVPERTLRHWRKTPEFRAALDEARREAWSHALARLGNLAGKAVSTLDRAMDCAALCLNVRATSVEVRAANAALSQLAVAELAELSARVAALETRGTES